MDGDLDDDRHSIGDRGSSPLLDQYVPLLGAAEIDELRALARPLEGAVVADGEFDGGRRRRRGDPEPAAAADGGTGTGRVAGT